MLKTNSALLMRNAPKTLTPDIERSLFLDIEKHRAIIAHLTTIETRTLSESARMGASRRRVREIRNHIVEANMALVLSVANRFTSHNVDYNDLVSAGIDKLFYCVDRFQVQKGFKFSTYASRSLWRHFTHLHVAERKHQDNRVDCDPFNIANMTAAESNDADRDATLDMRNMLKNNTANLSKMEMEILSLRFGLKTGSGLTLKEVGVRYGLTKERVRQIQRGALDRIREVMGVA